MLTQIPFEDEDHVRAHNLCNELGMTNKYVFTTMSTLGECYTLAPQKRGDKNGSIINTKEFGLLLLQTEADVNCENSK